MSRLLWGAVALLAVILAVVLVPAGPGGPAPDQALAHIITPTGTPGPSLFHVEIDADAHNGDGPCDPVDQVAKVGGTHEVAVCITNAPQHVGAFRFSLVYDDILNEVPELPCADGVCLDDNPDANSGATLGTGLPTSPDLGGGWDCNLDGVGEPWGDIDPGIGAGHGVARIACRSDSGAWTSPVAVDPWPLAVITFNQLGYSVDTLTLRDVVVEDTLGAELGSCNPTGLVEVPCYGASQDKTPPESDFHVEIDADARNGNGPCDPMDPAARVSGAHEVAVCMENASAPVWGFQFGVLYDPRVDQCVDESCGEADCPDDNPDANAGTTLGSGVPTNPDLGLAWDCTTLGTDEPVCDKPDSDPNTNKAWIICFSTGWPLTSPLNAPHWPLAVITFNSLADGVDALTLTDVVVWTNWMEMGSCNPVNEAGIPCFGATVVVQSPVGGIAEAPDVAAAGGSPSLLYAVLAGAAGVVALAAGGWYARRRRRAG